MCYRNFQYVCGIHVGNEMKRSTFCVPPCIANKQTNEESQCNKNNNRPAVLARWRVSISKCYKLKVKFWTLAIAPLTWVRLVTSGALQSRKWQLIGMSQWCCSALCGYPLPALTDNWTHGAASRHTIAPISHTRPSPLAIATTHFPSHWG